MPSQYGQDAYVIDLLGGLRDGYFLDSGASDGIQSSNTELLETVYGWRGICVEPNDAFFAALVRNRTCHCVQCCLYDRPGTVAFLEDAETLGGILGEYDPAHLRYATEAYGIPIGADGTVSTVQKDARTVGSVLRQFNAPTVIDYWSLDTEGSELVILKSFPFDSYSVRVITVEHNWLPIRDEIREFLERRGYRRAGTLAIDDCYVGPDVALGRHWRSTALRRARAS